MLWQRSVKTLTCELGLVDIVRLSGWGLREPPKRWLNAMGVME